MRLYENGYEGSDAPAHYVDVPDPVRVPLDPDAVAEIFDWLGIVLEPTAPDRTVA